MGESVGLKVGDNDLKVDQRECICVSEKEHGETDRTSFQVLTARVLVIVFCSVCRERV